MGLICENEANHVCARKSANLDESHLFCIPPIPTGDFGFPFIFNVISTIFVNEFAQLLKIGLIKPCGHFWWFAVFRVAIRTERRSHVYVPAFRLARPKADLCAGSPRIWRAEWAEEANMREGTERICSRLVHKNTHFDHKIEQNIKKFPKNLQSFSYPKFQFISPNSENYAKNQLSSKSIGFVKCAYFRCFRKNYAYFELNLPKKQHIYLKISEIQRNQLVFIVFARFSDFSIFHQDLRLVLLFWLIFYDFKANCIENTPPSN